MALADAVKGARYIAQEITWTDEDGTVVDLTGATLTGYKRAGQSASVALDGDLSLEDAANGVFSWAYGATDVGTAGIFTVQFIATYAGDGLTEKTLTEKWVVHESLD